MSYAQEQLDYIADQAKYEKAAKEKQMNDQQPTDKPTRKEKPNMRGSKNAALQVMHQNLGLHMTIQEVTAQAKPHKSGTYFTAPQIGQGLSRLASEGLIRRVGQGVYVYNPSDSQELHGITMPTNNLFEAVGTLDDGTPVVRGEDGQLLVLSTLEAYYRANIRFE